MSRVGKNPIVVPSGVDINISDSSITVKGKLGVLVQEYANVGLNLDGSILTLDSGGKSKSHKQLHGLYRALINNMVVGVSEGYTTILELVGVGYRASNQGQKLDLALGYSHNIVFLVPSEVKVKTISEKGKNPQIHLSSFDKQLLGQVVAKIRSLRKVDPYKGKGILFLGEEIRKKAGKTA